MKDWLENLSPRERLIVTFGAIAAAIIIAWGLIWRPLATNTAQLRESVADRARLVGDLRRVEALPQAVPPSAGGPAGQSILLIIDTSARSFGLAESFTQTRPNGPDEISVSFQRAPFDAVVAWLVELESTYGITAGTVSMTEAGQPGLVNGQVFLDRT